MGRLANLLWGQTKGPEPTVTVARPLAFMVDETSIDPAVFGLTSYASPVTPAPRIDRKSAIQVGAVKRTRDLICGTIGQLPIDLYGPGRVLSRSELLTQPEEGKPRMVTMTELLEDMLFEKTAWWRITVFGWHGYPVRVKRLDPRKVTVDDDATARPCPQGVPGCTGRVKFDGTHVHDPELIRFDSPNDALLVAAARAIRTCLALASAVSRNVDGAPPVDYLYSDDPDNEPEDDDVKGILADWTEARRNSSTAFLPGGLKYGVAGWSPEQLQLSAARQEAVLEIARFGGIDPEELGVSTTSRVYQNDFDRRKNYLDFTVGNYMVAIQDRLSMDDVTPPGFVARLNLDEFLRSDTLTRYQTYEVGLRVGALDPKGEVRELENKPPLTAQPAPQPAPEPAPQEIMP